MNDQKLNAGDPYCTNCGYALTGASESSKCPECGKPLIDVLGRKQGEKKYSGRRFRSTTQFLGLPLIDIALGPTKVESSGRAKGFIAIGDLATGWLAIGGVAKGFVAFGGVSIGVFSAGGASLGLITAIGGFAIGGFAAGLLIAFGVLAHGMLAFGYVAQGAMAIGNFAHGKKAYGPNSIGRNSPVSQEANELFDWLNWYFGSGGSSISTFTQPYFFNLLVALAMAASVALMFWFMWARHGSGGVVRSS